MIERETAKSFAQELINDPIDFGYVLVWENGDLELDGLLRARDIPALIEWLTRVGQSAGVVAP